MAAVIAAISAAALASIVPIAGSVTPVLGQSDAPKSAAKEVLFMCPHGAAKSVLASAYFQRRARERGLNVRVDSAGTDPDPEVGKAVAAHLTKAGYAIPIDKPRRVTARDVEQADIVVSLGCDLTGLPKPRGTLLKWDDVPGPGENFAAADAAIRKHVEELIDELVRASGAGAGGHR
jgi:protein-tyrosine-phosphatase